ncbi:nucleoside hydrolase [Aurantibacter crassamenti]|uniref:nucleoside hydrolase n=1 Tax=Aurantibacter crassamenti TaxID=1837375 RepID=UPI001EEDDD9C|nr:nucleoside hydrolase [Aurantibacter crassamenti]
MFILCIGCGEKKNSNYDAISESQVTLTTDKNSPKRIKVIFDTDANNELDDQHALAYLLFNEHAFETIGVTVNATINGGELKNHYDEAQRILKLCNKEDIPLINGADKSYSEIENTIDKSDYDGREAVDFILNETKKDSVTIIAVGKLTNIALALKKDSTFANRTKIVWLGSNYPHPGEYNQENDTVAMNYVLNSSIPFEMVTVRYGEPSGTDAVGVSVHEINSRMPGKGPIAKEAVIGRHDGVFNTFGDYSVSLFKNIEAHDNESYTRALFDMVAVAVLKNQSWGKTRTIATPILIDGKWVERPNNSRKIVLWEDFNKEALLADFFETMQKATPKTK